MLISLLMSAAMPLSTPMTERAATGRPSISVQFGKPTVKQTLFYRKMYEKKPFPDATLYYYDNGVYKIISQGEEHYGVYVVQGTMMNETYSVHYISFPSSDWGEKTAHHYLSFNRKTGRFTQQATWENDPDIAPQYGDFSQEENPIADPRPITWKTHATPEQRSR